MKKVIIVVLAIALAVAACGCKVVKKTMISSNMSNNKVYVSEYVDGELRSSYTIVYD